MWRGAYQHDYRQCTTDWARRVASSGKCNNAGDGLAATRECARASVFSLLPARTQRRETFGPNTAIKSSWSIPVFSFSSFLQIFLLKNLRAASEAYPEVFHEELENTPTKNRNSQMESRTNRQIVQAKLTVFFFFFPKNGTKSTAHPIEYACGLRVGVVWSE